MKKTFKLPIITTLFITVLFSAVSCKKDWLKPQPLSFYEPGVTYVDAPAMRAALVALGRNLRFEYYGG